MKRGVGLNVSLRLLGDLGVIISVFHRAHESVFRGGKAVPACLKAKGASIFNGLTRVGGRKLSLSVSCGGTFDGSFCVGFGKAFACTRGRVAGCSRTPGCTFRSGINRDTGIDRKCLSGKLFLSRTRVSHCGRRVKSALKTNSVGCLGISGVRNCKSSVISISS